MKKEFWLYLMELRVFLEFRYGFLFPLSPVGQRQGIQNRISSSVFLRSASLLAS